VEVDPVLKADRDQTSQMALVDPRVRTDAGDVALSRIEVIQRTTNVIRQLNQENQHLLTLREQLVARTNIQVVPVQQQLGLGGGGGGGGGGGVPPHEIPTNPSPQADVGIPGMIQHHTDQTHHPITGLAPMLQQQQALQAAAPLLRQQQVQQHQASEISGIARLKESFLQAHQTTQQSSQQTFALEPTYAPTGFPSTSMNAEALLHLTPKMSEIVGQGRRDDDDDYNADDDDSESPE